MRALVEGLEAGLTIETLKDPSLDEPEIKSRVAHAAHTSDRFQLAVALSLKQQESDERLEEIPKAIGLD